MNTGEIKPQTTIMMQEMIYKDKRPLDQLCFMIHPSTKRELAIPDNFNGVEVLEFKYAPLGKIYLSLKP